MSDLSTLSSCDSPSNRWLSGDSSSPSSSLASYSPNRNSFTAEELFEKAASLPAILENGRKVFGPPVEFVGVRPSYVCELYVANLPKSLDEVRLLAWLHRCGVVYEMRLMMESFSLSRGYAFVRYTQEREALIAYELLKCVYVDGERLSVYRSQGKNRLYISNIPKRLSLPSLEAGFKKAFRNMERCTAHAATAAESEKGDLNRGFAFIEFYDHETALEAKKKTTPGRMRMWGNDLKVQWAKPKLLHFQYGYGEEQEKTLSMEQGTSVPNDFCSKLRLFCLANNWCVPVVVYGRCLYGSGIQYGGILLKEPTTGQYSCMLMEICVERDIQDVHVAMCEVAIQLIERNNGFPNYHYILRILNGFRAEIVFSCANYFDISMQARQSGMSLVSSTSIVELALAFQVLAQYSSEYILNQYKRSFLVLQNCFWLTKESNKVRFYCIFPKFRNNLPLGFGFNDTEITLILTETNIVERVSSERKSVEDANMQNFNGADGLQRGISLKSQRTRNADGYTLRYVSLTKLENREFYHPEQRINVPPIWITGHSYQKSIFK